MKVSLALAKFSLTVFVLNEFQEFNSSQSTCSEKLLDHFDVNLKSAKYN